MESTSPPEINPERRRANLEPAKIPLSVKPPGRDAPTITLARKAIVAVIVAAGLLMIAPFMVPVGMGAVFAVLLQPLARGCARLHLPSSLTAAVFTISLTALIILPLTMLSISGVKSGLGELKEFRAQNGGADGAGVNTADGVLDKMLSSSGVDKTLQKFSRIAPVSAEEMTDQLKGLFATIATGLVDVFRRFLGNLPKILVGFAVFLFSLYYFLADGKRLVEGIRKRTVFDQADTDWLLNIFSGLCRSVILASVVSGLVQAGLTAVVSLALGLKQVHMIFLVVLFMSFLPLVGSSPFIIGLGLYQFSIGRSSAGFVILGAAIFIGSVDNIIRPLVIRGSSSLRLHPLLGLTSALGGLQLLGMAGIFLGPVLCGMLVAALELYLARRSQAHGNA